MKTVIALDTYERLKVVDKEYGAMIPKGTKFEVSEERLQVLLGDNGYHEAFVKLATKEKEAKEEEKKETKAVEVSEEVKTKKKRNTNKK